MPGGLTLRNISPSAPPSFILHQRSKRRGNDGLNVRKASELARLGQQVIFNVDFELDFHPLGLRPYPIFAAKTRA